MLYHPSLLQTLATPDPFSLSIVLPFLECLRVGIIQLLAFSLLFETKSDNGLEKLAHGKSTDASPSVQPVPILPHPSSQCMKWDFGTSDLDLEELILGSWGLPTDHITFPFPHSLEPQPTSQTQSEGWMWNSSLYPHPSSHRRPSCLAVNGVY